MKEKKITPFEEKLLGRVTAANKRLESHAAKELPAKLTVRRVKCDLQPRAINEFELKKIREKFNVSQAVFAAFLQVPIRTYQEWEQGRTSIPGVAGRLLGSMIDDSDYWMKRMEEAVSVYQE